MTFTTLYTHWTIYGFVHAATTRRASTNASESPPPNPHEVGVGEISPIKALDPGLVIETTITDHLYFLCYRGYKQRAIRSMSNANANANFTCPKGSAHQELMISSLNYPTISIGRLSRGGGARKVKRVVTNVGAVNATYVASVNAGGGGLAVRVAPRKLVFGEGVEKAGFKVLFDGKQARKGYNFGDITWFDGSHLVRIVFAVNVD